MLGFVLLEVLDDVGDVEKRVALEAHVDECRLHAREHLGDAPFVDVADDRALFLALDPELDDQPFVEDRDPRLVVRRVDDQFLRHRVILIENRELRIERREMGRAPGSPGSSRPPGNHAAGPNSTLAPSLSFRFSNSRFRPPGGREVWNNPPWGVVLAP